MDLEAFALSLLRPGDWEAVHYICSRLRLREAQLPKFEFRRVILDKSLVMGQMQKTLDKFVEIAGGWTKISSADSPEGYYDRRADAMMNRGQAELIGLRSDTYIPQKSMVEWTRRLGFPGLLQVIEIRNPESYLERGNIVPTSGGRGHSPREYWLFPTAGPYIGKLAIGQSADLSRLLPAKPGTPAPGMMRVTRTGENTFELLFDRQDEDRPYNIVVGDKPIPDSARIGDHHYLTFRRIHPLPEK
ncbi:MAG: hypothetical protein ACRDN1_07650 [Trebonia sp.]